MVAGKTKKTGLTVIYSTYTKSKEAKFPRRHQTLAATSIIHWPTQWKLRQTGAVYRGFHAVVVFLILFLKQT